MEKVYFKLLNYIVLSKFTVFSNIRFYLLLSISNRVYKKTSFKILVVIS